MTSCIYGDTSFGGVCSLYSSGVCEQYIGGLYIQQMPDEQVYTYNRDLASIRSTAVIIVTLSLGIECQNLLMSMLCHLFFPVCFRRKQGEPVVYQKICYETCLALHSVECGPGVEAIIKNFGGADTMNIDERSRAILERVLQKSDCGNATLYPKRESLDVPECYYPEGVSESYVSEDQGEECFHDRGLKYNGSLDRTESGFLCQSWTDTCHTPSLIDTKDASANYCRNPTGYRKKPWCFTMDSSDGWEYCSPPVCEAINGRYSSWSEFVCNKTTCLSHRFRTCTNPSPKFGGKNCSEYGVPEETYKCCELLEQEGSPDKNVIIVSTTLAALLMCSLLLLVLWKKKYLCFKNKMDGTDEIEPEYKMDITSETIRQLHNASSESSNEELVDEIYLSLLQFQDCLCHSCISSWLVSRIESSELLKTANKNFIRNKVCLIVEDLKEYQLRYMNLPSQCINGCSYESTIKEWLLECVEYSHLDYSCSQQQRSSLDALLHAYDHGGRPLYHKLDWRAEELSSQLYPSRECSRKDAKVV